MKLYPSMLLRPSSLAILLAYVALIVLMVLTPYSYVIVTRIMHQVKLNSKNVVSEFQYEIENSASLVNPMTSSSTNLARFLNSTLEANNNLSFSDVEYKVAPVLFQAIQTIPHLVQISYIQTEGLFFSYYIDQDQVLAVYSNSTRGASKSNTTIYYIRPVNRDTGKLFGDATIFEPANISTSWFLQPSNSTFSLGTKFNNGSDLLFVNSARVTKTGGLISMGFPVTSISDFFTRKGSQGVKVCLTTKDGKMLLEEIEDVDVVVYNDTVSFQSVNNGNGGQCKIGGDASNLNVGDAEYLVHCGSLNIMGIESVYIIAFPQNGLVRLLHNIHKTKKTLLSVKMAMLLIAMLSFLLTNIEELKLRGSLKKQMEATEEAEQKSMNKSHAFASASHDVRASLAAISGLIDISFQQVVPGSDLETNLKRMKSCIKDLLDLFNSLLDTSKIEAGKMNLEEEEFDVFQLLEDVVDLYHPVAMKKGVDIVIDPCDGSLLEHSLMRGDRKKLKRVLSNLLSNAIKFTDVGHITVRAWAKKPSLPSSTTMGANRFSFIRRKFSWLFCRKGKNEAHDHDEQDRNCMDFTFEVDDTGVGIPKEMHKTVFESYVQVKETSLGQEGTGLGLAIVQSLVRLMHGDIRIIEKDNDEKGTCFRFNVLLTEPTSPCRPIDTIVGPEQQPVAIDQGEIEECGESSHPKSVGGTRILVVEDSFLLRTIVKAILQQSGAHFEECEDGEQAVKRVEERLTSNLPNPPYDYILMDCQMPVMDGYEATRRIREMEKGYGVNIPIIALSANDEEEAKRSIEAGMDHHIVKPFNKEKLLEAIRKIK